MQEQNNIETYRRVHQAILKTGIIVTHEQHQLTAFNQDIVSPHLVIIYCHQGSSRFLYDMREFNFNKGELGIGMPGHVINQLSCTDDFVFTRIVISAELYNEIRTHIFSPQKYNFLLQPKLMLTEEQAQNLLSMANLLDTIARHFSQDPLLYHQLLMAQLSVGYKIIQCFLREQDKEVQTTQHADLFNRFCKLVIEHYRESREVKFYASRLNYTPKHFSKIIRQETNGLSPADWIAQYVVAQAKRMIEIYPTRSFGEIARMLCFSESASFFRYFKRVTGLTPKQYRESLKSKQEQFDDS